MSPLANYDVTCLKGSAKFGIRSTCYYVDADVVLLKMVEFLTPPMCYFAMDPRIQLYLLIYVFFPYPSKHGPHHILQSSTSISFVQLSLSFIHDHFLFLSSFLTTGLWDFLFYIWLFSFHLIDWFRSKIIPLVITLYLR